MKRSVALSSALLLSLGAAVPASAGPYADSLAKCLVEGTTPADKSALVQWMFAAISLHPDVNWMANVPAGKRDDINRQTAQLFERLITESCVKETREALKYEGAATIESAFGVLGQVASREMFTDKAVQQGTAELGKHIDEARIEKVLGPAR